MPPGTDHGNQAHGRGFVGLLCAAIIASAAGAAALAGEEPPRVTNAWIRWLPGGIPMAAYVTIVNPASRPITLVGVRSAKFADSSIHQDVHVGTNVEMRPVNRLVVPAHSTLVFENAGYHIMLAAPKERVEPGSSIPITFILGGGAEITAEFSVRGLHDSAG